MSFLHRVSFLPVPFSPPPRRTRRTLPMPPPSGSPERRDPDSRVSCAPAPAPAGARFAAARIARLIARMRPRARGRRRAHPSRPPAPEVSPPATASPPGNAKRRPRKPPFYAHCNTVFLRSSPWRTKSKIKFQQRTDAYHLGPPEPASLRWRGSDGRARRALTSHPARRHARFHGAGIRQAGGGRARGTGRPCHEGRPSGGACRVGAPDDPVCARPCRRVVRGYQTRSVTPSARKPSPARRGEAWPGAR